MNLNVRSYKFLCMNRFFIVNRKYVSEIERVKKIIVKNRILQTFMDLIIIAFLILESVLAITRLTFNLDFVVD